MVKALSPTRLSLIFKLLQERGPWKHYSEYLLLLVSAFSQGGYRQLHQSSWPRRGLKHSRLYDLTRGFRTVLSPLCVIEDSWSGLPWSLPPTSSAGLQIASTKREASNFTTCRHVPTKYDLRRIEELRDISWRSMRVLDNDLRQFCPRHQGACAFAKVCLMHRWPWKES